MENIIEGSSAVNESALTGESIPVDKTAGDTISAATLNTSGYLKVQGNKSWGGYNSFADNPDGQ